MTQLSIPGMQIHKNSQLLAGAERFCRASQAQSKGVEERTIALCMDDENHLLPPESQTCVVPQPVLQKCCGACDVAQPR